MENKFMKKIVFLMMLFGLMIILPDSISAQNVCSKNLGGTKVNLEIANATGKPFVVNFVDENCREGRSNQQIEPDGIFRGSSYNGHAYRVREVGTNRLLREIVADPSNSVTIVYTAPSDADIKQQSAPSNTKLRE